MSLSIEEYYTLVDMFRDLPQGRSARNHSLLTPEQVSAARILRTHYNYVQLEKILNISVYRLRKIAPYHRLDLYN